MLGTYTGRSTGRALESLKECLSLNGPEENHLATLRAEHGLTQAALASKAGVAQGYISEVEAGKKRLSAPAAEKVGRTLGVEPGVLLMSVRMGALMTALETGEARGPLTQEIVACMALISENLPDGSLKQLLMATMTEALQDAVKRDKEGAPAQQPQAASPQLQVATKTRRNPSRDQWGRRVEEDAEPKAALKSHDGITRDGLGRKRPAKARIERDPLGRNRGNRRLS